MTTLDELVDNLTLEQLRDYARDTTRTEFKIMDECECPVACYLHDKMAALNVPLPEGIVNFAVEKDCVTLYNAYGEDMCAFELPEKVSDFIYDFDDMLNKEHTHASREQVLALLEEEIKLEKNDA